jgi:hypothetical protein
MHLSNTFSDTDSQIIGPSLQEGLENKLEKKLYLAGTPISKAKA